MPGCRNMAGREGYKNILIQLLYNMEERSKNRQKNVYQILYFFGSPAWASWASSSSIQLAIYHLSHHQQGQPLLLYK